MRDAPGLTGQQRHALTALWDTFRDLPTIGTANAVGITKAIKLVTGGRIGPALDSKVREVGLPVLGQHARELPAD